MTTRETFEDLYSLLGVTPDVTIEVIKATFRRKAHEWHPDRNRSPEATAMMQRLLAAYKILTDKEARERYDHEYNRWKTFKANETKAQEPRTRSGGSVREKESQPPQYEDPDLNKWVRAAKRQAAEELADFLEQLRGAGRAAGEGAIKGMKWAGVYLLLSLFLFLALKGCRLEV